MIEIKKFNEFINNINEDGGVHPGYLKLINNKFSKGMTRKPSFYKESFDITYGLYKDFDVKEYLESIDAFTFETDVDFGKLEVMENNPDYRDDNYLMLVTLLDGDGSKIEDKFYFIDTQGYDYIRYLGDVTEYYKKNPNYIERTTPYMEVDSITGELI